MFTWSPAGACGTVWTSGRLLTSSGKPGLPILILSRHSIHSIRNRSLGVSRELRLDTHGIDPLRRPACAG